MRISLDNGTTFSEPEDLEALRETIVALWDAITFQMDDRARELAHENCPDGDEVAFLRAYLGFAEEDLVIG